MLARLYYLIKSNDAVDQIPGRVLNHLLSDWIFSEKLASSVQSEVLQIKKALNKIDISFCFLKGAAYLVSDLHVARGRLFSDIDLMMSFEQLDDAERALMNAGWMGGHYDKYDQQYYRRWMHELPPLKHVQRQTVLDVHHNILPLTASVKVDATKLMENSICIPGTNNYVLAPVDMVLHSAAHLFYDGELDHGFRDISDLDLLFKEFGCQKGFWGELTVRAEELDLSRALYYAVRYTTRILQSPVPSSTINTIQQKSPGFLIEKVMDFLFIRALVPDHPSCDDRWTGLARWLLYIRSHWLRMP
ncbi:MAG: hypothetical protein GQ532_01025, partial [Methylomarinum sp.]|nr:hypothetical protein [Methylomarinum sp.]